MSTVAVGVRVAHWPDALYAKYDLTDDGDERCRRLRPSLEWAADLDG